MKQRIPCVAILASTLAAACSGASAEWTGSVDAVFRYRPSDRSTVVFEVRPGSLAARAGLQVGDRVVAIDGTDVAEAPYEDVRAALRGPVGTGARLTVDRDGRIVEIVVERRPLKEGGDDAAGNGAGGA